ALQRSRHALASGRRRRRRRGSRRLPVGATARRATVRRAAQGDHRRRAAQRARLGPRAALSAGALGASQHRARRPGRGAEPRLGEVSRGTLAVEYASAHCFCLPTVQEGFGLVFAEAMAAGLPVVACRAAAVPEIVEDRRTGFLVSPRSPVELATALETLLMNE